jgi:hypothetical protein
MFIGITAMPYLPVIKHVTINLINKIDLSMLKLTFKTNSFLALVLILSIVIIPDISLASANKAAIDGSFITGDLCGHWTDARWQQEFTAMKNAGMHYVVLASVVQSFPGKVSTTIYPSSLPNTKIEQDRDGKPYPDVVDACLRNAKQAGIKVFIGIDANDRWWDSPADDSVWLYSQMDFDNKVCDEVWGLYKAKYPDTFYGWYWVYEADNVNFKTQAQQNVLTNAMNMQLDHLTAANERLPFMWCPFMNSNLGTPQAYQEMWQNVFAGLHTIPGDIFCPQDCVGAGGLKIDQVVSWFTALRKAVDTKPGLLMWSDIETFDLSDNTSATIDRIVTQLKIEQPYVDNYITWEYSYYDSPYNIDPGFHKTYLGYLKNGTTETTPPTTPANFTAKLLADGNVELNWDTAKDNIGVCGYYVYRNGIKICKKQVPIVGRHRKINSSLTSLTDVYLNSNTNYSYQVRAYDFANNVSAPSTEVTINTGNIPLLPNKVSAGCSYTISIPDCTDSTATKNTKLTDGIYADSASVADHKWDGFHDNHQKPRDVIIDLGKVMPVQEFIAGYLLAPKTAVFLPVDVKVLVSKDNVNFTDVGRFPRPNLPYDESAAAYKYRYRLSKPVEARYVNFRTVPAARWFDEITYEDEFEVRNNVTSGTK